MKTDKRLAEEKLEALQQEVREILHVVERLAPNAGRKGAPRVLRCDLYGGGSSTPRLVTESGEPDIASEVLASRA